MTAEMKLKHQKTVDKLKTEQDNVTDNNADLNSK